MCNKVVFINSYINDYFTGPEETQTNLLYISINKIYFNIEELQTVTPKKKKVMHSVGCLFLLTPAMGRGGAVVDRQTDKQTHKHCKLKTAPA